MNPEEPTDAAALGACGHVRRNVEVGEPVPYARLVRREDREVFRLDGVHVAFVGDTESASAGVLDVVCVECFGGGAWAGIVAALDVTARRRGEHGSCALVACNLRIDYGPCRDFEDVAVVRGVTEVIVLRPTRNKKEGDEKETLIGEEYYPLTNHHCSKVMSIRGTTGRLS